MRFTRGTAGILAAVTLVVLFVTGPSLSAAFKNVQVDQTPPRISLKDLDGREWKSPDIYAGGVTVVVFWATWSPRSAEVLADLEKLRAEVGTDKVRVVAVNCEHPQISAADREAIAAAVKKVGFSGTVLVDDGLIAFNDYGAMALPSTLVVGAEGKVAYSLSGYPTTMREDLADAVRKAAGLPTSVEVKPPQEYVPKNHALMYYNLGRRLIEKGQDEKAEAQLLTAVEKDPDFKKAHLELGLLFKRTGRSEQALEEFRRVTELDPREHEALYQVAAVSLRAGKFAEAEGHFRDLHTEFPEREELALGLALAQLYQGRTDDAAKTRAAAAGLFPAPPRYVAELGAVAEQQKDLATAAEFYRRALEAALKGR